MVIVKVIINGFDFSSRNLQRKSQVLAVLVRCGAHTWSGMRKPPGPSAPSLPSVSFVMDCCFILSRYGYQNLCLWHTTKQRQMRICLSSSHDLFYDRVSSTLSCTPRAVDHWPT